jgi:hypothetical protein
MNKFVKSGSNYLIVLVCFFAATMFIDQANLLDIVVGNNDNIDIEHPEEVDASLVESTPVLDKVSFDNVTSSSKCALKLLKDTQLISKKVIVDEDSPSTASINAKVDILSDAFINEHLDSYSFVTIQDCIYLHNRTLLI